MKSITAIAFPNIALIKYWGNRDQALRLPANGSISMSLSGLYTRTQVTFDPDLRQDQLQLNGQVVSGPPLERVSTMLERVRCLAGIQVFAMVVSENNFPMGSGIASSASAFAALALAASTAAGLTLSEMDLSRLARTGSGSACRSIPGGYVEWQAGENDLDSYAYSIAPPEHWDLVDCIALVSAAHKLTGSTQGHALADTSPLQAARVAGAPNRLGLCRKAILERDFEALSQVAELDSNLMHAAMMTSNPPLLYWQPPTIAIMQAVTEGRKAGWPICYSVDAGPNVHVLCPADFAQRTADWLMQIEGVQKVFQARPAGPAHLVE